MFVQQVLKPHCACHQLPQRIEILVFARAKNLASWSDLDLNSFGSSTRPSHVIGKIAFHPQNLMDPMLWRSSGIKESYRIVGVRLRSGVWGQLVCHQEGLRTLRR
jgi:hypothetical protein